MKSYIYILVITLLITPLFILVVYIWIDTFPNQFTVSRSFDILRHMSHERLFFAWTVLSIVFNLFGRHYNFKLPKNLQELYDFSGNLFRLIICSIFFLIKLLFIDLFW